MPYITIPVQPKQYQLTFEDIMFGVKSSVFNNVPKNTYDTRTVYRDETPQKLLENLDINDLIETLEAFNNKHRNLIDLEDKSSLYHHFQIPKRSGGWRPIDAPNPQLDAALRELKYIFENKFYARYHTAAFAYVEKRSTMTAVERHQKNESKWFLKIDLHNFFGKTTKEFVMARLSTIYPFSEIVFFPSGKTALRDALSLAFLNGGLPQGTPISPLITNLMMIPIDHAISKGSREHTPFICYTRYADDMTFSAVSSFEDRQLLWDIKTLGEDIDELKDKPSNGGRQAKIKNLTEQLNAKIEKTNFLKSVIEILEKFDAPFEINAKKTHYGNSNGRNWILGVMLNKDNQITLGHVRKNNLKVDIYNFMKDYSNGSPWSIPEAQSLDGTISYHKQIEKETTEKMLRNYSNKFDRDVVETIRSVISG